jgi:hypothetical protein
MTNQKTPVFFIVSLPTDSVIVDHIIATEVCRYLNNEITPESTGGNSEISLF